MNEIEVTRIDGQDFGMPKDSDISGKPGNKTVTFQEPECQEDYTKCITGIATPGSNPVVSYYSDDPIVMNGDHPIGATKAVVATDYKKEYFLDETTANFEKDVSSFMDSDDEFADEDAEIEPILDTRFMREIEVAHNTLDVIEGDSIGYYLDCNTSTIQHLKDIIEYHHDDIVYLEEMQKVLDALQKRIDEVMACSLFMEYDMRCNLLQRERAVNEVSAFSDEVMEEKVEDMKPYLSSGSVTNTGIITAEESVIEQIDPEGILG